MVSVREHCTDDNLKTEKLFPIYCYKIREKQEIAALALSLLLSMRFPAEILFDKVVRYF